MFKRFSPLAAAGAVLSMSCLGGAPAQAFQLVTFVSGKGADGGTCASPASPCRSFQFAISQTTPGGEVKALDPAHYGGMVITKSISITGVEGASINRVSGDAVTINAGPNDKINFGHLILDGIGSGFGQNGIVLNSGGSLTIMHCTIRNFAIDGIFLRPTGKTNFLIADTIVSDNSDKGILVQPVGAGSAKGALDHVLVNHNKFGLYVGGPKSGPANVAAIESVAINNTGTGFTADLAGGVLFTHSVAAENAVGVDTIPGIIVDSAGNNFFDDPNLLGTLTKVGTQ